MKFSIILPLNCAFIAGCKALPPEPRVPGNSENAGHHQDRVLITVLL
ncbi:hypothetical protein MTYP_01724 [Methylophilaceae bacterium]|nr:hypothetical protein MTYP_01724 [Methylophilaceae bacterium]